MKETILCAAIHYDDDNPYRRLMCTNIDTGIVVCGHRHGQCIQQLAEWFYPEWQTNKDQDQIRIKVLRGSTQGFLTNLNRFLNREEAMIVALKANQLICDDLGKTTLYSEHLY